MLSWIGHTRREIEIERALPQHEQEREIETRAIVDLPGHRGGRCNSPAVITPPNPKIEDTPLIMSNNNNKLQMKNSSTKYMAAPARTMVEGAGSPKRHHTLGGEVRENNPQAPRS